MKNKEYITTRLKIIKEYVINTDNLLQEKSETIKQMQQVINTQNAIIEELEKK